MSVDLVDSVEAGSGRVSVEKTPRCWTGGHNWSTGSKLAEFLAESGWWHGFTPDDTRPSSVQTHELFSQIRVGDRFAIKGYSQQGLLKVYLTGIVEEIDTAAQRLRLMPSALPEPVTIKPRRGGASLSGTLREVTDPAIIDWMFHQQPYPTETREIAMPDTDDALPGAALNTILYGPPGTGKTYNTILQAVGILDGVAPETLSMDEAKPRWDELRGEGRIEFVTFHQSYGYEDFVEGIRPVMTDEAGETPRYEVFEGVLKRIALRALGAMLEPLQEVPESPAPVLEASVPNTEDLSQIPFDTLWDKLQSNISENPNREYQGLTFQTVYRLRNRENSILGQNLKSRRGQSHSATRAKMSAVFAAYREKLPEINSGHVTQIQQDTLQPNLAAVLYRELKLIERVWVGPYETEYLEHIEPVQKPPENTHILEDPTPFEYRASEYLNNAEHSDYYLNTANPPRYVLVIDEINRGNISKIFGELITLIEDDKRIGGEVALTVTLPHSRETFGIPSNLYILGTMNTADKSIALVDVALRRRFEFEELMPDVSPATCPGMTPEMRAVIVRLNERIVLRKDRDHQIGHAFFRAVASPDDFNRVFARKIIPLLQEYFYGDWESLRYVLGETRETGERESRPGFIVPLSDGNEPGARNRWQWYRDAGQTLDVLKTLVQNYRL